MLRDPARSFRHSEAERGPEGNKTCTESASGYHFGRGEARGVPPNEKCRLRKTSGRGRIAGPPGRGGKGAVQLLRRARLPPIFSARSRGG